MHRPSPISWTAINRARLDRARIAPGVIAARGFIQALTRHRRTRFLTPAGSFDRAVIMSAAVEAAKLHQTRTGSSWSAAMSVSLTAAWKAARAERLARSH